MSAALPPCLRAARTIPTLPARGLADTNRADVSAVDSGGWPAGSGALVLRRYEALVESGVLRPDARQQRLVKMLSLVLSGLVDGLVAHKLSHDSASPGADAARKVKGMYVYGEVGSGKSMAMNLFSEAAKELLPVCVYANVCLTVFPTAGLLD